MLRELKIVLTLIMVVSLMSAISQTAFAETYSGKEVMDMASDLADKIEATGNTLPESIQITSAKKKVKLESTLYLMAKWLELYGKDNSIPEEIPFLEIQTAGKTRGGVTSGQVNLEDLFAAGASVAAVLEANPKMPPSFTIRHTDTGNTVDAEVSPFNLIYIFARTIRWVAVNGSMPNYASVRKTTLPGALIRPEFSFKEVFMSYTGDRPNYAPDQFAEKLGLNFTSRSLNAYYPLMIRSAGGSHDYLSDPDDRYELKYRLGNFAFRGTNNYNNFDGTLRDPFYAVRNNFSDTTTYDFYKINGKFLGNDIQLHQVTTTNNDYVLASVLHGLGAYKFNAVYGERSSNITDETSANIILWLDGPMPVLRGNGTMSAAWISSDNNLPVTSTYYNEFNGTGDGYRLAMKDVRIGRFTLDGIHLQTDSNMTSLWAPNIEHDNFVGSGRLYDYGMISTNVRTLGQNVKISLSGSQETNDVHYELDNCRWPNEEMVVKLLFEVQPASDLKLYTSVQSSEAYMEQLGTTEHLLGTNTQWAGGLQKEYSKFKLNVDTAYNFGYAYDRNIKDFAEPNWSVYVRADNLKATLQPIVAAYYQYNQDSDKPADLRTYARINGKINDNLTANVAFLNAEESTNPSWDGFYQYYGFVYTNRGMTVNTGYLINEKDRLYVSISQKIKGATLSLTYGVENGLGDGDSRNNSIDDGRPWEALMGSYTSGTDPQYTLKLRVPLQ